jgi:6-phosphofructokinase
MSTLAILTNGGDTCALNASIRSIRDNAYHAGYKKIYGIRRGYQGLIDGWIDDITHKEIDPKIGGSCLGSQRMSPTHIVNGKYVMNEAYCHQMMRCLKDYRVDVLVVIGGDGTLQATKMFQEWVAGLKHQSHEHFQEFSIIGFLKTIDNDIRTFTSFKGIEVSLCPGFPSAVRKMATCVEDLRVTARTAERAFTVETMGRDAGWLAAAATFGGAEILLIKEHLELWDNLAKRRRQAYQDKLASQHEGVQSTESKAERVSKMILADLADEIADFYIKNRNVLIAVGEGFEPSVSNLPKLKDFTNIIQGLYGTRKKVGASEVVTILVSPVLEYYFLCLSHLCARRRNGGADLSAMIESVLKETKNTPQAEKYSQWVVEGHPLKDWDIRSKLRGHFGLEREEAMSPADTDTERGVELSTDHLTVPPYKFEIRPHRTDYTPRSGAPSSYDYKFATVLGQKVGQMLLNKEFGAVPALKEIVSYEHLTVDAIKTVPIDDIETKNFLSLDFFNRDVPFQVSPHMIEFFRTIMSGPKELKEAVDEVEVLAPCEWTDY